MAQFEIGGVHESGAVGAELQRRLALVAAVSARLGGGGRFHDNLAFLAAEVANVLGADACVLRELRGDKLALLGTFGVPEGALHERINSHGGIAEVMIRDRAPVAVVHANEDPITAPLARSIPKNPHHFRFLSYGGAPMFADGRVVGVLGVYMTRTPREFEQGDLDLLQIIANAVGIALSNDRLFSRFAGADAAMRLRISGILGDGRGVPAWDADERMLQLAYDMSRARSEIEVHYQPMRAPGGTAVLAHEALVRWRHPRQGLLVPDQFIPLAEQTGHIGDIGLAVADIAIREFPVARLPHRPEFVSVNVSIVQLADPTFVERLAQLAEDAGIEARHVAVEITERAILDKHSEAGRTVDRLAERGFPIFIDDFGAGYSSLSHLLDLPVTGVKIDRCFMPHSPSDTRRRRMLSTVAAMSRDLGMTVVAEGIEEPFQEEIAGEAGVDLVQGFGIGEPMKLP